MSNQEIIKNQLIQAQQVLDNFISNTDNLLKIEQAASLMVNAIKSSGKIISCGNGGSFCDAMHFAEELSGRFRNDRKALPAIAISDASHITCVGNDYGFDFIFSRFIEGLANTNDVLLAITTSGNSKNVINAINTAKEKGMKVVVLTGKDGGEAIKLADVTICVPHFEFADRIQEIHIKVIHILILLIEKGIFPN